MLDPTMKDDAKPFSLIQKDSSYVHISLTKHEDFYRTISDPNVLRSTTETSGCRSH